MDKNHIQSKKEISELFQDNLVDILRFEDQDLVHDLNDDIIDIIIDNPDFSKELEKMLYKNENILTNKDFFLEGDHKEPTVANWLSDFLKQYGSNYFDNVTLSRYITFSDNGKILGNDEKNLLKNLLRLYRNIKFFSRMIQETRAADWEIVPINKIVSGMNKVKELSGPPKTEGEKEIEKIRKEEEQYPVESLERKVLDEEIEKKQKIEGLRIEANKYPAKSLERKALEAEIKKLLK